MDNKKAILESQWVAVKSQSNDEILIEALQGHFYDKGECDLPSTVVCSVEGMADPANRMQLALGICKDHNASLSKRDVGHYL